MTVTRPLQKRVVVFKILACYSFIFIIKIHSFIKQMNFNFFIPLKVRSSCRISWWRSALALTISTDSTPRCCAPEYNIQIAIAKTGYFCFDSSFGSVSKLNKSYVHKGIFDRTDLHRTPPFTLVFFSTSPNIAVFIFFKKNSWLYFSS